MNISFKLEPVPDWMPVDNRLCRACDQKTEWVVVAKGMSYIYPCCDSESCQTIVRNQITRSLESKQAYT